MDEVKLYRPKTTTHLSLPLADGGVHAGFPSPAQDYIEQSIDLNRQLITHPASTFFARVVGDSMTGRGIEEDDILVVDRSLEASDGDLVVCYIDGEFAIKILSVKPEGIQLLAANPKYKPIDINTDLPFEIWGVVTYSIKRYRV